LTKREWREEIKARDGKRPKLVAEERPWIDEAENCVICNTMTRHWLFPENAPLCPAPAFCLDKYLADPTVYDPRGLNIKKVKML